MKTLDLWVEIEHCSIDQVMRGQHYIVVPPSVKGVHLCTDDMKFLPFAFHACGSLPSRTGYHI
jgi:hypothetical protein